MRFSLKDMMWSVTFASLGLASVSMMFATRELLPPYRIVWFMALLFLFLPGALFGAAVGKLYQRAWLGVAIGINAEWVFLVVVWMAEMS